MSLADRHLFQDITGAGTGSQFGKAAKRVVEEVLGYSEKLAWFLSQEIKSESRSIASERLKLASRRLDAFAGALGEAVERLRAKQSDSLADIVEAGSKNMMRLSRKLGYSNLEEIIADVENFARRQPGTFWGAAMLSGFLVGQMFSSLDRREEAAPECRTQKESSIEYRPESDEEGYHERH